jgi:diguanylate cyclase (GGDEF)-like protein
MAGPGTSDQAPGPPLTQVQPGVTDRSDVSLPEASPAGSGSVRPGIGSLRFRPRRLRHLHGEQTVAARVAGWLHVVAWVVLVTSVSSMAVAPAGTARKIAESAAVIGTSATLVVLIIRLVVTSVAWRERRAATLVLAASILLYAIGSSTLSSADQPDLLAFPAPGEGFFIASYIGMAAFLLMDTVSAGRLTVPTTLEAVITCGGASCLAGAVLLSPAAAVLPGSPQQLMLALLYPLIDILLAVIVLAEVALRRRAWSGQSASLVLGFVLLAVADSTFIQNLARSGSSYDFSWELMGMWGAGLTLIVAGACGRPREVSAGSASRFSSVAPLAAAFAALVVLVLRPPGDHGFYLAGPAVLTLLAAGGRLVVALRQARGAAEAYRLSQTDDLTGLPNRRAVLARIESSIERGTPMSLLLLDLDSFKEVNDTLGHAAGDTVLQLLGRRLRSALPPDVLVARLGGDEFAVAVPDGREDAVLRTADEIRTLVSRPVVVQGHTFVTATSIGIAIRGDTTTASDVLRHADIAMYQAKANRSGALAYDPERDEFTTARLKTAELLRRAIPDGQLLMWYQPQVDAVTNDVTGIEALVRWQHPELGLLAPFHFLPVARQTGLMPALTEAILDLVLTDAARWQSRGISPRVSFNVAPPELLSDSLMEHLMRRIDSVSLPPGSLVLEVTEDSFIADPARARAMLDRIREHDVQVAIDDYGTGFSSLSYLRDLPVHELKLDRSFVSAIQSDPRSRIIVASTAQMARGLGLRTVAEGVEDQAIATRVRALGVDVLQGYHIARPMPADDIEGWLAQWSVRRLTSGDRLPTRRVVHP